MRAKPKHKGMKDHKGKPPMVKIEIEVGEEESDKKKRKTKDKNGSYE